MRRHDLTKIVFENTTTNNNMSRNGAVLQKTQTNPVTNTKAEKRVF